MCEFGLEIFLRFMKKWALGLQGFFFLAKSRSVCQPNSMCLILILEFIQPKMGVQHTHAVVFIQASNTKSSDSMAYFEDKLMIQETKKIEILLR